MSVVREQKHRKHITHAMPLDGVQQMEWGKIGRPPFPELVTGCLPEASQRGPGGLPEHHGELYGEHTFVLHSPLRSAGNVGKSNNMCHTGW